MRVIAALLCTALLWHSSLARAADGNSEGIPKEWLVEKVSVEQAEQMFPGVVDERTKLTPQIAKPFGYQHDQWEALKAEMKPGDELWTFSSPADYWQHLAGRLGIALVRDGKIVDVIVTTMN
jgi:hypothetical protein